MNLEDYTKERILEDVPKLQYLYKLKDVTRYDLARLDTDSTESVAEHLYGMQLLAQYFLPLEDNDNKLNRARVYELITVHDLDEIETGDYVSYIKTDAHRRESEAAIPEVLSHLPAHIKDSVSNLVFEYEAQETPEAQFAKAIDKIEPLIQIFNEKGSALMKRNKCTKEDSFRVKAPYIEHFPYIKMFALVLHQELIDGDYYWSEGD